VQVTAPPVAVDELAEQQRAPVAQPRLEGAELVARVHLRDGTGLLRKPGAHEKRDTRGRPQRLRVEPQLAGQLLVEDQQGG
jgi:hypothetical protein